MDEVYARTFEFHDPTSGMTITTREEMRELAQALRLQSPDIEVTIDEEIDEADTVVHRWTARGTNVTTGEFHATPGISIYHLRDGLIVSEFVGFPRLAGSE